MEALSPTMEEGRLVKWNKNEGDAVEDGEALAEVETDKAIMELVARATGTLLKHVGGSRAQRSRCPSPVAVIGDPGEAGRRHWAIRSQRSEAGGGRRGNSAGAGSESADLDAAGTSGRGSDREPWSRAK